MAIAPRWISNSEWRDSGPNRVQQLADIDAIDREMLRDSQARDSDEIKAMRDSRPEGYTGYRGNETTDDRQQPQPQNRGGDYGDGLNGYGSKESAYGEEPKKKKKK
jgi:hypothetical protein